MSTPIVVSMDGTLLNWVKQIGEQVNAGDVVAEIEADKATVEISAPVSGVILMTSVNVGESLKTGSVIGSIGASSEETVSVKELPSQTVEAKSAAQPVVQSSLGDDGRVKASPLARKIAEERGIVLDQVVGTGPGGRIVKEDVEKFRPVSHGEVLSLPSPVGISTISPQSRKLPEGNDVEVLDVSNMRKRIVSVTVESKQQIPHFYVTSIIDVEPLLALRKLINETLPDDSKVSVNDLIVKATALTLRKFPNLNTHYYGDKLIRHKRIHVGIAVALPNGGLINVVARDADKVSVGVLAAANKEMIGRAREGKVKPEDIGGATFTVSNLGPFDVDQFAAIINPPESGILAVSTAQKTPVVKADGSLGVGMRMKVTISVDHRVSDGAEGAQFLQEFKSLIENPMRLLV